MPSAVLPNLRKLLPLSEKLLAKYIDDKLSTYDEPTKKGTPKGEPVGFSLTKYTATLYALRERVRETTGDLMAQAKELKISYGLLRKWRSEQGFKALVSQHEKEFTSYLLRVAGQSGGTKESERSIPELETARALLALKVQEARSVIASLESRQKESARKLMILLHGNIDSEFIKSNTNPKDLRKYQLLALDQAIELLEDRRAATKHRKDVINLLSGVRETLE